MTVISVTPCYLLPQIYKLILQLFVAEKSAIARIVKDISAGLVQIYNDIKTVLFAPADTAFNVSHSAFDDFAVIRLDNIVIYRHTDVIKSHCRYLFNILFGYEGGIMLVIVLASTLRDPTAQVYTLIKSVKISHDFPPRSFRHRTGSTPAISLVYSFIITAGRKNQYLNCGGFYIFV